MRQKSNETGSKHFKLKFLKLFTIYQYGQNKRHGHRMDT